MTIPAATSMLIGLLAIAHPQTSPFSDNALSQNPAETAATLATDQKTLAAGNTDFALAYFNQIRSQPGNIIFSPLSISIAFSMVEAGAAGSTARQIRDVMHLQLPEPRLHPAFAAMLDQFHSIAASGKEGAPSLAIANSLWGVEGYPYRQAFLDTLKADYNAKLTPLAFADSAQAAKRINGWVADATAGKITDLLSAGDLDRETRLVLVNAVYFKGGWAKTFGEHSTVEEDFHLAGQRVKKVPMMHQRERMGYFENEQFQAVTLGYAGSSLSMCILLPRQADGLAELEQSLDSNLVSKIVGNLSWKEVILRLPRFKLEGKSKLNDILQAMGMTDAFDPSKADFSGMVSHEPLYISRALHQAMISVDERGTEAAAATAVIMSPAGAVQAPEAQPPVVRADHPFLFMVRDSVTGSILFMGRVSEP